MSEMAALLSRRVEQFKMDVIRRSIPHIKLGEDRLFDSEEVMEFLASQSRDSSEKAENKTLGKGKRLGIKDAAKLLTISTSTLYRWVREGRVPFYRPGRDYYFYENEISLLGKHDLSTKQKPLVKLPPIEIDRKTEKTKRDLNERYRKLLKLD